MKLQDCTSAASDPKQYCVPQSCPVAARFRMSFYDYGSDTAKASCFSFHRHSVMCC